MTAGIPQRGRHTSAWQAYIAAERTYRRQYLETTWSARLMYGDGSYESRVQFAAVEAEAFDIYFQAGRAAWAVYTNHLFVAPDDPSTLLAGGRADGPPPWREPPTGPIPAVPTFTPHPESAT